MQQDKQGMASESAQETVLKSQGFLEQPSLTNPVISGKMMRTLGLKPMVGTYTFLLAPGMKLCCPEVGCMLTCGSCSSGDRKKSLKTPNPRLRHGDRSCGHFPPKG